jgi:Ca2+-binding RTX toxin-like protein
MTLHKAGRLALVTMSTGVFVGLALLNGGSAQSIGGLCNGEPASATWLDASGQYGPALLDGTDHADTIIGSDGDDHIDSAGGDDVVCGGAGHNHIHGGDGDDVLIGAADHDHLDGGAGDDTVVGFGGDDTVAGGTGNDFLVGGSGDDVMISIDNGHSHDGEEAEEGHEHEDGEEGHEHEDGGHGGHGHDGPTFWENEVDKVNAGDDFDVCLFGAGDELANCEY